MSKLEEALIDKLTLRPEVREKARVLLRTVHSKTGPGTGYDIGEAKTGLPAICAYIASKALGYAEITEEVAQKASCLAPKTFSSTIQTIKKSMLSSKTPNASPSKPTNETDPTAYAMLIKEHKIGQPLRVESWMKEAQAALTALPRFRQDFASRVSESGPEVRLAAFFWVCRAIKLSTVQHIPLVDKHSVSLKVFSRLVKTLEDECVELKESIRATIKEMRSKKKEKANTTSMTTTTTTTTPMSTPSRPASPTKSALRDASRPPSLASGSAKRKVAFSLSDAFTSSDDDGVLSPETPSKRPRTTPRRPTASSAARTLPVRNASSSGSESFCTSSEGDAEDIEMVETPSKRPRTTSRRPTASSAARTLPVRKASSSGSESFSASSEEDAEDVEMLDAQPLSTPTLRRLVVSEPVAGPSTPRRSARVPATPTHAYRTPPSARSQMLSVLSADEEVDDVAVEEEEEEEEAAPATPRDDDDDAEANDALPLSRRFRPVFLDRAQWAQSAPRLARDRAAAERRTRVLIERWGYPFDPLRIDATPKAAHV